MTARQPLDPDLARRFKVTIGQLDRLDRERQPWEAIRDQLIVEAKLGGASARTIATAAGVSHTYVAQLHVELDPSVQPPEPRPPFEPIVVDTGELDPATRAATLAMLEGRSVVDAGCPCTERGQDILGSCLACWHDGADHDQKGCHHAS